MLFPIVVRVAAMVDFVLPINLGQLQKRNIVDQVFHRVLDRVIGYECLFNVWFIFFVDFMGVVHVATR